MHPAIGELRALLLQFERSGLKDIYLRAGDWTVFMARPDGAANPMAAAPAGEAAVAPQHLVAVPAPHPGLFEPACAAGQQVEKGALVGMLDVLGRKTEVFSQAAGRVASICAAERALVEYGDSLLELDLAA